MAGNELQNMVMIEGTALLLITVVIISAFNHWKYTLFASSTLAAAAIFSVWSTAMAVGSVMIFGPASILLWFELDNRSHLAQDRRKKIIRIICWSMVATGILLLILKNILNIYSYLT